MAKDRGRWKITFTTEPDDDDLMYIALKIQEGYREGEIGEDTDEDDVCLAGGVPYD